MDKINTSSEQAKKVLDNGFLVVPIQNKTKRPALKGGEKHGKKGDYHDFSMIGPYTYDQARLKVQRWNPQHGIGIFLGLEHSLGALDCDADSKTLLNDFNPDLANQILDLLSKFNEKHHNLIYSTVGCVGSKGYKAFFRGVEKPVKVKLPSQLNFDKLGKAKPVMIIEILAGGDLKTAGSPAISYPSIHKNGNRYETLTDKTLLNTKVTDLPELPRAVVDDLEQLQSDLLNLLPEDMKPNQASNNSALTSSSWNFEGSIELAPSTLIHLDNGSTLPLCEAIKHHIGEYCADPSDRKQRKQKAKVTAYGIWSYRSDTCYTVKGEELPDYLRPTSFYCKDIETELYAIPTLKEKKAEAVQRQCKKFTYALLKELLSLDPRNDPASRQADGDSGSEVPAARRSRPAQVPGRPV
jgi:hypothetical protein